MLDDGLPYHVILDEIGEAAKQSTPKTSLLETGLLPGLAQATGNSSSALALRLNSPIDLLARNRGRRTALSFSGPAELVAATPIARCPHGPRPTKLSKTPHGKKAHRATLSISILLLQAWPNSRACRARKTHYHLLDQARLQSADQAQTQGP